MKAAILCLIALFAASRAAVIELDANNFDEFVNGDKNAFVEFYAPWCGHCKRLIPAYEEVGKAFDGSKEVVIAKVDADSHKSLAGKYGVRGFPTLKFFPKGTTTPEDYKGGRTAEDIIKYINEKSGVRGRVKKAPSFVVDLDPSNFDRVVKDPTKDVLVEFYAPWCGHCKALATTYEEVGTTFANDESCVVARLDADGHRDLATGYDITGFPTIKFFPKDNKDEPEPYERGRDLADFVKFLNEKCGTSRLPGGELTDDAGVITDMSELASRFMTATGEREDILTEAQATAEDLQDPNAEVYVKVMKKIQDKGDEYVQTEKERLGRILDGDLSSKKADELTRKRNILRKFEL